VSSPQRQIEELMDEVFPAPPFLEALGPVPCELACVCGDLPYVVAIPGDTLTCPTCGACYGVATRLTLLPLER